MKGSVITANSVVNIIPKTKTVTMLKIASIQLYPSFISMGSNFMNILKISYHTINFKSSTTNQFLFIWNTLFIHQYNDSKFMHYNREECHLTSAFFSISAKYLIRLSAFLTAVRKCFFQKFYCRFHLYNIFPLYFPTCHYFQMYSKRTDAQYFFSFL